MEILIKLFFGTLFLLLIAIGRIFYLRRWYAFDFLSGSIGEVFFSKKQTIQGPCEELIFFAWKVSKEELDSFYVFLQSKQNEGDILNSDFREKIAQEFFSKKYEKKKMRMYRLASKDFIPEYIPLVFEVREKYPFGDIVFFDHIQNKNVIMIKNN